MPSFTKADINLLSRIRKNLRDQIIDHEEARAHGVPADEVLGRLRKRDRLLREEREIEGLSKRIALEISPTGAMKVAAG